MQIVSLTTDFGVKDYYVAKLKGQLLQQKRDLQIIDVSHHIAPYDIIEAAFFIKNIYRKKFRCIDRLRFKYYLSHCMFFVQL